MHVRCGGCTFGCPTVQSQSLLSTASLAIQGGIALGEDGVDVYLSHCFHQGKKNPIKLAAFSLLQAGVTTSGKSELDLRQQKHHHCDLGWTQELTPQQWPQTAHPAAWGRHSMNHTLAPPDNSKIKPESHPGGMKAFKNESIQDFPAG